MVSADVFSLFNQRQHRGEPSIDYIVTNTCRALDRDPLFSRPGDSGSWVFDPQGRVVGVMIGRAEGPVIRREVLGATLHELRAETWQYIVPIRSIFRDIERVTGCKVSLELTEEGEEEEGRD